MGGQDEEVTATCADLSQAIEVLTGLGFRVDTIIAADDPSAAVLSGHGIRLFLTRETKAAAAIASPSLDAPLVPAFVLTRNETNAWKTGRAGMQYRDLIPGRQGGRFIASHIRIPEGGPVPDYVHFHDIRFQMIYVHKGWVRVVYEDQGEPFVMHAGDCVLQPPRIRHRVLESSPGLEVFEIGSPAVHATHADHEMALPTRDLRPDRDFAGQRFSLRPDFDAATGGLANARVRTDALAPASRMHGGELYFGVILEGAMSLTLDSKTHRLREADAFTIPASSPFDLTEATPDLAWLEITSPSR